ncbi:MAG: hypothetical protein ACOX5R_04165 [bacterium]|jgi:uncharacterized cupredoxin-like copper-binding protein
MMNKFICRTGLLHILTIISIALMSCSNQNEESERINQTGTQRESTNRSQSGHSRTPVGNTALESEAASDRAENASPAGQNSMNQAQPVHFVDVDLFTYEIRMPDTIPSGPVELHILNRDQKMVHSFIIEGPEFKKQLEQPLQPAESATLRLDLAPGQYRVYCPVSDHAERGTPLTLNIREQVQ